MDILALKLWSPYWVGAGIGILSWFTFLLSDKPIGCSTAFARTSGMIEQALTGKSVKDQLYYQKFPAEIDWEWMFVLGIIIGSFLFCYAFRRVPVKVASVHMDSQVRPSGVSSNTDCFPGWYSYGYWGKVGQWLYQWSRY